MEGYLKGLIKNVKKKLKDIDWIDHLRIAMSQPTVQLQYDKGAIFGFSVQEIKFEGCPTIIVSDEHIWKVQENGEIEVLAEYNGWSYFD